MTQNQLFLTTKNFLEQKPAAAEALKHLKPGTEIRLMLDGGCEAALFYRSDQGVVVEPRPAVEPDVEFRISNESVRRLSHLGGENMAEFGIEVLREIGAGNMGVRVVGRVWGVLRNGYLSIVKAAGPDFAKYLASQGFDSIGKVIGVIKKLAR